MKIGSRPALIAGPLVVLAFALVGISSSPPNATAAPKPDTYWNVDEVRAGMKGHGLTVMHGTRIERFTAEVLGVLKNTSPGRDLVLCRLSGLCLDKTGVIAGMSGSPVYLDGKLLGAVAYAWAYGKEPIAGVTPFSQMHGFVAAYERRDLAAKGRPTRVGLGSPVRVGGRDYDAVTVSQDFDDASPRPDDGLWLRPLSTPLAATGFTPAALKLLRDKLGSGFMPVQSGGASSRVVGDEKDTPLEAGGPLSIAMITGDFDLSGIGTVTHIEGDRVYGWGHPFMSLGDCEFPLMTGYIHTVYPRQTVSFKMGSPLRTAGVINADVSTCVAGWLGRKPDMLPVRVSVALGEKGPARTFNVEVARQRSLIASLVFTALTNAVDMEGELPEDMTADLRARIEIEGHAPLVIEDTFSGVNGSRAPSALFGQVSSVVNLLTYNPYQPVRINRVECDTHIVPGRRTAEVEAVELDADTYAPGDAVTAGVFLRPFKGRPRRLAVALKLPADLPEGGYTATVCDDLAAARQALRDNPALSNPQSTKQVLDAVHVQLEARRTNLVLRVPVGATGVAVAGKSLPNLPPSMVQVLGHGRRTGAQTISEALVARRPTDWVIQGSETVRFSVVKNKRTISDE